MRVAPFLAHHQQLPTEGMLVFPDLFLQLLALQELHIRQVASPSAQLAEIRWYSQFFQRSRFTDVNN